MCKGVEKGGLGGQAPPPPPPPPTPLLGNLVLLNQAVMTKKISAWHIQLLVLAFDKVLAALTPVYPDVLVAQL